jgi:hypothetical protein
MDQKDVIKAVKKASRELFREMPKGGRHKSKKDKARSRKVKHAKREKGEW